MRDKILSIVERFNQEQWNIFIYEFALGKNPAILLQSIADDDSSRLLWLYNLLLERNKPCVSNLTLAIVTNLRTITIGENNKEIIYVFIFILHEVKPLDCKSAMLQLIKDGRFINFYYGSDNLQYILIRAYIFLESPARLSAEQIINSLQLKNKDYYYLYLQVFYYAYLGKKDKALFYLSKFLTNKFSLPADFYAVLENTFIDCVPDYLTFDDLIIYLNKNKLSVAWGNQLTQCKTNILEFWRDTYGEGSEDKLLFLEDYFYSIERNAILRPGPFERMSDDSKALSHCILLYYNNRDYNRGPHDTVGDLMDSVLNTFKTKANS